MPGFGIFRIADGKIAEEWLPDDLMAFAIQAGGLPDPTGGQS